MRLPALQELIGGLLRRTWFVVFVAVMACSAFAARAVAAFFEAEQLAPAPHAATRARTPAPSPAPTPRSPDVLVERNIFCSTCAAIGPAGGALRWGGPGPARASYSGLPAILIATSVGGEPRATVRVIPTDVQGSWELGDTIPGVGRIEYIGFAAIEVVDERDHRHILLLLDEAAAGHSPGAATPDRTDPPPPFADRLTKINDTTFEVDRQLVRDLVTGVAGAGGTKALPVPDGAGGFKGLRMYGIRAGTVANALGLRNGDMISTIDGEPIKNVQQLLDLFAKLDQISTVELGGTRTGKPLNLTLRLR
jgi:general secretion pathway protein C